MDMFVKYKNIPEGYIPVNTYWIKSPCPEEPIAELLTKQLNWKETQPVVFRLNAFAETKLTGSDATLELIDFRGNTVYSFTSSYNGGLMRFQISQEKAAKMEQGTYYLRVTSLLTGGSFIIFNSTSDTVTII